MVKFLLNNWGEIKLVFEDYWYSVEMISLKLREFPPISKLIDRKEIIDLNIAGSPECLFAYVLTETSIIIFTPFEDLTFQDFTQELIVSYSLVFKEISGTDNGKILIASHTKEVLDRLNIPKVLLISLFHSEMYPTSRLTLGISSIASFLRSKNLAKVHLIDYQFIKDRNRDVFIKVKMERPDIIGLSVNFGQYDLMEEFLNEVNQYENYSPSIVLGNILPAMCYKEILKNYPKVIICQKEGELMMGELCKVFRTDRSNWKNIPRIIYYDKNQLIKTSSKYLQLKDLPVPALDTVIQLFKNDGVITAEFSRGCHYNICSFCPRIHKGAAWRGLPVFSMIKQWQIFHKLFVQFNRKPYVFLADEEFIGIDNNENSAIQRWENFMDLATELDINIKFDAACRADQIFNLEYSDNWHLTRSKFFKKLKINGLSRLFLGVESGSDKQLQRYNKGHEVNDIVSAIRHFSLLGIKLRFGFIFFDPLMTVQDICENIDFLGRTDVVLKEAHTMSNEKIFQNVKDNHNSIIDLPSEGAVFDHISYMISPLEVLLESSYLNRIKQEQPLLISGENIDTSFARIKTKYLIPEIQVISDICQNWINYCFPIIYTIKGLRKVSSGKTNFILFETMKFHRRLSYFLVRSLMEVFGIVSSDKINTWELTHKSLDKIKVKTKFSSSLYAQGKKKQSISILLQEYVLIFKERISEVDILFKEFPEGKQEIWKNAYEGWKNESFNQIDSIRIK